MNKMNLVVPVLTLMLAACGTQISPNLTVTSTSLKLGEPQQLKTTLAGTVTWTSSQPDVIAVSSSGEVTGRRLTTSPVTITATADGAKQTAQLDTYGLELSMCTYNNPILENLRLCALTKFRTKSGAIPGDSMKDSDAVKINIYSPAKVLMEKLKNRVVPDAGGKSAILSYYTDYVPEAGTYTADVQVAGETYTASAVMDPTSSAEGMLQKSMVVTETTYEINGQFGKGTGAVRLWCLNQDGSYDFSDTVSTTLPAKGTHHFKPLRCDYISYTTNPFDFSAITPQQVNMAWQYGNFF